MRRLALPVAFLMAFVAACSRVDAPPRHAPEVEAEEYAVYRAALQALYPDSPFVLVAEPRDAAWVAALRRGEGHPHREAFPLQGVDAELLADLEARSAVSQPLRAEALALPRVLAVVPRASVQEKDGPVTGWEPVVADWEAFYARFPAATRVANLSRVGFNRARTRALVDVDLRCHRTCWNIALLVMEKRGGQWVVADMPIEMER